MNCPSYPRANGFCFRDLCSTVSVTSESQLSSNIALIITYIPEKSFLRWIIMKKQPCFEQSKTFISAMYWSKSFWRHFLSLLTNDPIKHNDGNPDFLWGIFIFRLGKDNCRRRHITQSFLLFLFFKYVILLPLLWLNHFTSPCFTVKLQWWNLYTICFLLVHHSSHVICLPLILKTRFPFLHICHFFQPYVNYDECEQTYYLSRYNCGGKGVWSKK